MISLIRKVYEVFTKECMNETKYRENLLKNAYRFKLKGTDENVNDKIRMLSDKKFVSCFHVNIETY